MSDTLKSPEFLKKLQAGDRESLKVLYEHLHIQVYKIVFSLIHDQEKTADIMQETFVKVMRHIGQLQQYEKIEYWVFRIAVNLTWDLLKHEKREVTDACDMESIVFESRDTVSIPEGFRDREAAYHALLDLVDCLPLEQATVFTLKYLENLREQDIAEILMIPLGTVKSRLSLAKNKLRRLFEKAQSI